MVRAFAPASISNVNCGFDVLGAALEGKGDIVTARKIPGDTLVIEGIQGDDGKLPLEREANTATIAVSALLDALGRKEGIGLTIQKGLPIGSGLGSSASSPAAAVTAVNALLNLSLSPQELLPSVIAAEAVLAGGKHADNAAPALFGGICLVRSADPPDVIALPYPSNLCLAICSPKLSIRTKEARASLPQSVPLEKAVQQWANCASFVASLYESDEKLMQRSLHDLIVEPHRAKNIPHFYEVREAALRAGALAAGISGSGPALFAFASEKGSAERVATSMLKVLEEKGTPADAFSCLIGAGARILEGNGS